MDYDKFGNKKGKDLSIKEKMNVVLLAPEIPHNTGNVIRLCANVGANLHLIEPLGFQLDHPRLRRASLDYSDLVDLKVHQSIDDFFKSTCADRVFVSTPSSGIVYTEPNYQQGDTVIFGSEGRGLPDRVVNRFDLDKRITIPMVPANRSINLSNAAAIVVFEMWRQVRFSGASISLNETQSTFS